MPRGITKSCPFCKKILFRYANFQGACSFEKICPNPKCGKLVAVRVDLEPKVVIEEIELAVKKDQ